MEDNNDIEVANEPGVIDLLPQGFGKQPRTANVEAQLEQARRRVKDEVSGSVVQEQEKRDTDSDSDKSSDYSDDAPEYPVSHELVIRTHERAITSATLDLAGNRLITGSVDCNVKYHDLSSMNPTTIRAFKSFDPNETKQSANNESHPVHQVLFNPNAPSLIFMVTSHPQVKIYDRDGSLWGTTVKGDMYLRDMRNTKGHISEVTCGDWHPNRKEKLVTAATDSTLRIWDVNSLRQQQDIIVHKSRQAGSAGRSRVTAVKYGSSSSGPGATSPVLVAATYDGTLSMWAGDGPFLRPSAEVNEAHTPSTWTSSLDISPDGRLIISRGGDDMLKLWDTRKLKSPLRSISHPTTASNYPTSSVRFSPAGSQILVGSPTGHLHILNAATLKPELVTPVSPSSPVISAFWHQKINQIVTTSADGSTRLLFDPSISKNGGLQVMSKAPKHRHIDDDPVRVMDTSTGIDVDVIVNPGTMRGNLGKKKNTGLTMSGKSRDPRRPHKPDATPFAHNTPDERHVRNQIPLSSMRDEDPREALLKYADKAVKDQIFTSAWSKTQPNTVFREASPEEDAQPDAKRRKH